MKQKPSGNRLPPNPATYYRESGWRGWADLLSQQSADVTDPRDPVSVLRALVPAVADNPELWWEERLIREALKLSEPGQDLKEDQ